MTRYDPAGHPLLSAAAQQLSLDEIAAHAEAAVLLLGRGGRSLADTAFQFGTDEHTRAVLAVVYQVNDQVARGDDVDTLKGWSRGGRSAQYRDGLAGMVSQRAQALIDGLITPADVGRAWPIAAGLR